MSFACADVRQQWLMRTMTQFHASWWKILKQDSSIVFARNTTAMPPALAQWLKAARVAAWSLVGLLMVGVSIGLLSDFIALDPGLAQLSRSAEKYALPFLALSGAGLYYRHVARLRRRVWDADYLICTTCGYCLRGLEGNERCPECGSRFHIGETQEIWRRWF